MKLALSSTALLLSLPGTHLPGLITKGQLDIRSPVVFCLWATAGKTGFIWQMNMWVEVIGVFFSTSDSLSHPEYSHNLPFSSPLCFSTKKKYLHWNKQWEPLDHIRRHRCSNFMNKEQHSDSCRKDKLERGAFYSGTVPEQKGFRHHLIKEPHSKQAALPFIFHSWDQFGFFFWGVLQLQNKTHLNVIRAQCGNLSTCQGWKQPGLPVPEAALIMLWQCSHPRLCRGCAGFLQVYLTSVPSLLTEESRE